MCEGKEKKKKKKRAKLLTACFETKDMGFVFQPS